MVCLEMEKKERWEIPFGRMLYISPKAFCSIWENFLSTFSLDSQLLFYAFKIIFFFRTNLILEQRLNHCLVISHIYVLIMFWTSVSRHYLQAPKIKRKKKFSMLQKGRSAHNIRTINLNSFFPHLLALYYIILHT